MSLLGETAIFLGAAVVAVPVAKRLGLGSVLGYLAGGAVIGPWAFGFISDVESILHFAEFGVVLLLFVIGLELHPARLWTMRRSVFGLGGAQVALSAAVIGAAGLAAGLDWRAALAAALALALSSTAFALQTLAEKNQLPTRHGRAAFSVLLFQDLAAIPILAFVPLLAAGQAELSGTDALLDGLKVIAVLAAVVVGGHYLLQQAFRLVARTGIREIFTALALLTVTGMALLMEAVGLSMALGAFLAGVLLADSEFRHALEADMDPFKGLLLGLFFIAVGMSINFGLALERPAQLAALVVGLVAAKFGLLYGLGRAFGQDNATALRFAAAIAQGGEFAFVILGVAVGSAVMDRTLADLLILVVIASMVLSPPISLLCDRLLARRRGAAEPAAYETPAGEENQVIIAGFGRFGQIVARVLRAKRIGFTALEIRQQQVDFVKRFGNKVYYGDPARLDLLRAAKADQAVIFVLAMDDIEASLRTAETVRKHFPHLVVFARARNRHHALQLMELGVTLVQRETFLSSLEVARQVLEGLGLPEHEAETAVDTFRRLDERRLADSLGEHTDEAKMIERAKKTAEELEELFAQDAQADKSD